MSFPLPLFGSEPNTWAHSTVVDRLPKTVLRVIEENKFSAPIEDDLRTLADEIPYGLIRPLEDFSALDTKDWEGYIAPRLGKNWLEVPWFFAEHYLYRRIMEAVRYFKIRQDPFIRQKRRGLSVSQEAVKSLAGKVNAWLEDDAATERQIIEMLTINLWGNQADLSLWPAGEGNDPSHANLKEAQQYILANDAEKTAHYLMSLAEKHARIDFLIDNAGFELVTDLALADLMLTSKLASVVKMHVKAHPTFVSDALATDVWSTVYTLKNSAQPQTQLLGERVYAHLMKKRLELVPDFYWNSPLAFWDIPQVLRQDLEISDLVISKGDANYRRLLGDRHWAFSTPFAEILEHFSAPVLALRTLKAEVAAGIPSHESTRAKKTDPIWMVDGRWGVVQIKSRVEDAPAVIKS